VNKKVGVGWNGLEKELEKWARAGIKACGKFALNQF